MIIRNVKIDQLYAFILQNKNPTIVECLDFYLSIANMKSRRFAYAPLYSLRNRGEIKIENKYVTVTGKRSQQTDYEKMWEKIEKYRYITEEVYALIAAKRDWRHLQYIRNQTEEMCLIAVKQYWGAIEYIHNPTEEMGLIAVKQSWLALRYIHNQTEEMASIALKQSDAACVYIKLCK